MRPDQFSPSRSGRVVQCSAGAAAYWAFVPDPLPPALHWGASTVALLSTADRTIGELGGVGRTLPNPHLLFGPFTRREAVLSSRIEGTQASLSDLLLFEANPDFAEPADVLEVANYIAALELGLEKLRTLPVSLRLIRAVHKRLMQGVRGHERTPGEFRKAQNWIGPPGCTLQSATYVPPPPNEMLEALAQLERFLHARDELPALVRLALVHYQFEAIHPFLDGNGRVGRLLITLLLCAEDVLPLPLLYLSAYFEHRRREYYAHLLRISTDGAWIDWIDFFLQGVAEQATDALGRAKQLVALREDFRERIQGPRTSVVMQNLIDRLFERPSLTTAEAAKSLGVTTAAAQRNIDRLVNAGVLREATGRRSGRVWVAEEIRKIVE